MARVPRARQFEPLPSQLPAPGRRTVIPRPEQLPRVSLSAQARGKAGQDLEKTGLDISQTGEESARIGAIEQARDEDRQGQALSISLRQFARNRFKGNDDLDIRGFSQEQGNSAIESRAKAEQDMKDEIKRIRGQMTSPRAQLAFDEKAAGIFDTYMGNVATHTKTQRDVAEKFTDQAETGTLVDANLDNPIALEVHAPGGYVEQLRMLIHKQADKAGVPGLHTEDGRVQRTLLIKRALTAVYTKAVTTALDSGDLFTAREIQNNDLVQGSLTPEGKAKISKLVRDGSAKELGRGLAAKAHELFPDDMTKGLRWIEESLTASVEIVDEGIVRLKRLYATDVATDNRAQLLLQRKRLEASAQRAIRGEKRAERAEIRTIDAIKERKERQARADARSERAEARSQRAEKRTERGEERAKRGEERSKRAEERSDRAEDRSDRAEERSDRAEERSDRAEERAIRGDQRAIEAADRALKSDQRAIASNARAIARSAYLKKAREEDKAEKDARRSAIKHIADGGSVNTFTLEQRAAVGKHMNGIANAQKEEQRIAAGRPTSNLKKVDEELYQIYRSNKLAFVNVDFTNFKYTSNLTIATLNYYKRLQLALDKDQLVKEQRESREVERSTKLISAMRTAKPRLDAVNYSTEQRRIFQSALSIKLDERREQGVKLDDRDILDISRALMLEVELADKGPLYNVFDKDTTTAEALGLGAKVDVSGSVSENKAAFAEIAAQVSGVTAQQVEDAHQAFADQHILMTPRLVGMVLQTDLPTNEAINAITLLSRSRDPKVRQLLGSMSPAQFKAAVLNRIRRKIRVE